MDTQTRERARDEFDANALEAESAPLVAAIEKWRAQQMTLSAADPNLARLEHRIEKARAKLARIAERHTAPAEAAQRARRPGRRFHYGLIAQEVKGALDVAGVDPMDAAFWQENAKTGEQMLSYTELMVPMLRAIQELAAEVGTLRHAVEGSGAE